ncbi:MAG: NAD(P)-dependent oxidoreductase [Betaproteobacteria bacterium RBG_16_58_11]|nr:MAG: NAD(P)-dependent oxidoreductase [Betaproteobacteria bacterium RBG_16_58_11]
MRRLLIIGCGDVALRAVKRFLPACRIYALTHTPARAEDLRRLGITPIIGDLDHLESLSKLAGLAHCVMHFAPPQSAGDVDQRTHNLLAVLDRGEILPQRLVYISTTGVYGNCDGHWVEETRSPHPTTARAKRRLSAETQLREWGIRRGVTVSILRVPGIYSSERLPLARLKNGTPTLIESEDSFTNHIHAEDLARVAAAAMYRGKPGRIYNATDDSNIKMGDWFDLLATRFNLPKPRRITRAQAQTEITPSLLSFLNESRRISNKRLKRELRVRLAFPDVDAGTK